MQGYLKAIQSVVVAVAVAVELAAVVVAVAANFEAAVEEGAPGRLVGALFAAGGPYYLREAVVQTSIA